MFFGPCDLNVSLPKSFVDEVDSALDAQKAELVLLHTTSARHALWALKDYLRLRAREMAVGTGRGVMVVRHNTDDADLTAMLDVCRAGDLVFFSELDPRPLSTGSDHAVSAAARFAEKGATVFAVIHGSSTQAAQERLQGLWVRAIAEEQLAKEAALPSCRFIPFTGRVDEVPVSR